MFLIIETVIKIKSRKTIMNNETDFLSKIKQESQAYLEYFNDLALDETVETGQREAQQASDDHTPNPALVEDVDSNKKV
jgi:hypothetical protein